MLPYGSRRNSCSASLSKKRMFSKRRVWKAGARVALVGVDVDAREALALEGVADHGTILVEGGAGAVDRGRALGFPAMPLIAHALNPHRPAHRLRQECRVD